MVTVDADAGEVLAGTLAVVDDGRAPDPDLELLLEWARG